MSRLCVDCGGRAGEHASGEDCAADMELVESNLQEQDAKAKDRAQDLAIQKYLDDQRGVDR